MSTNPKVYLCFRNKGEIDVNAFRLLGASSKEEDDSKIGFFGSGLKYAVSLFLREGIDFKVFSGINEIKVGTETTQMRGQDYSVITINDVQTSMTTRMGKDWKLWFAIREVYCNVLDEPENSLTVKDLPKGEAGTTNIYVEFTDAVKQVWNDREKYFAFNRVPVVSSSINEYSNIVCKAYEPRDRTSFLVYRKGILVHEQKVKNHVFEYDFSEMPINESRVVASISDITINVVKFWCRTADSSIIARLFDIAAEESYEYSLEWFYAGNFSDAWLEAINGRVIIPSEYSGHYLAEMAGDHVKLPFALCKELKEHYGEKITVRGIDAKNNHYVVIEKTPRQIALIEDSLEFLKKAGFDIKNNIDVVKLERNLLGTVDGQKILLSEKVFEHGRREVVSTILEEFSHIKTGDHDMTRAFQNYWINQCIILLEEKTGNYL